MDKDISNMMNKFSDMMNESSSYGSSSVDNENSSTNFDINTILKLKSVMDKMNNQNDPRSNLLKSLKPYLRESRQSKADQYINLLTMGKVIEAFRESGGNTK